MILEVKCLLFYLHISSTLFELYLLGLFSTDDIDSTTSSQV